MAPTVFDVSGIVDLPEKPPVLWIRGDADQIVSDTSVFDLAFLGSVGAVLSTIERSNLDLPVVDGGSMRKILPRRSPFRGTTHVEFLYRRTGDQEKFFEENKSS